MHVAEGNKVLNYRPEVSQGALVWVLERECYQRVSNIGKLALEHLERDGFKVHTLSIGMDVVQRVKQLSPSAVIIETAISRGQGLDLCRGIRRFHSLSRTPVVLLSPNASEEERVLGLESGADDYITESSSGREVVARVRAVMRRFMRLDSQPQVREMLRPFPQYSVGAIAPSLKIGDIEIDASAMTIVVRGNPILTTNLEFRLLYYLVHHQGCVFTRDQLLDAVWGPEFVELRSVDACIRRLRRKMEPDALRPTYLRTVRGAGYCLHASAA